MLRVDAINVTPGGEDAEGTADYNAYVKINYRTIWHGKVVGHRRASGASELLRRIAFQMDCDGWSKEEGK